MRKIDETITRFTYRNYGWIFGMDINPSSIVPAMEPGRLISMSDYGVYYSNTDQKIDFAFNMLVVGSGVFKLAKISNALKVVSSTKSDILAPYIIVSSPNK